MSLFEAIPLSRTERQIRIAQLKSAASSTDPIEVQLHVVDLDREKRAYEALSYCWGTGGRKHDITCNGQRLAITYNLFRALECLRRENEDRTLWIDAICIDQQNPEERAAQVQLMRSIYRDCASMVVWLGPDPDVDGVDHFYKFAEECDERPRMYISEQMKAAFGGTAEGSTAVSYDKTNSNIANPVPPDALKGTWAVMERAWWSRLWIIQELALPPTVVVTCGNLSLPWLKIGLGISTAICSHVQYSFLDYEEGGKIQKSPKNHYLSLVHSRIGHTRPTDKSNTVLSSDLASLLQNHR